MHLEGLALDIHQKFTKDQLVVVEYLDSSALFGKIIHISNSSLMIDQYNQEGIQVTQSLVPLHLVKRVIANTDHLLALEAMIETDKRIAIDVLEETFKNSEDYSAPVKQKKRSKNAANINTSKE